VQEMTTAEERWGRLCEAAGCDRPAAAERWRLIASAYAEPQRHYHTLDHIEALLALRDAHAALFPACDIADLAILLHDVVYDPARQDNEAVSAAWARAQFGQLAFPAATIDAVARWIELSRHDPVDVAAVDPASGLAAFLDLDLSVLAADPPDYRAYTHAIRREYAIYPDRLYRPGRARVLARFLERPAIYLSERFHTAWEERARRNIAAELRELEA